MVYNEKLRIAVNRYRQRTRERTNELERIRYYKTKIEHPEKYQARKCQMQIRQRNKACQKRHIDDLMNIDCN